MVNTDTADNDHTEWQEQPLAIVGAAVPAPWIFRYVPLKAILVYALLRSCVVHLA